MSGKLDLLDSSVSYFHDIILFSGSQYRLCAAVTNKVMFVRSFIEDEGRSFEIGFQEQPP
ncbi:MULTISPECIES: hypothetical protein [unclassified Wolbachia]|uniref:hypothetical protein n=1 Tax=unclassified Wolbachia TaxID=2640676 RepID=UPI002231C840|nr:hypothetical protein [Wolbachia endosymbiont (group A) of Apoderus coryli]